jgi:hypothetical protein
MSNSKILCLNLTIESCFDSRLYLIREQYREITLEKMLDINNELTLDR